MLLHMGLGKKKHIKTGQIFWMSLAFVVMQMFLSLAEAQEKISDKGSMISDVSRRLVPDNLYGVDFGDSDHGIATGYFGTILRTSDGGQHWVRINSTTQELIRRVDMVSASKAWAIGHRGSILHSHDGGITWVSQKQANATYLRDISFASEKIGWAVGHDATILHTRDGGATWQKQKLSGYKGRDLPRLNGVAALNETSAVLVGEFGVVGLTRDGGENWQLVASGVKSTLTAIGKKGTDAVAVGLDGAALYLSLEGAPVIRRISTGVKQHLFDVAFNKSGQGVAVGQAVLLRMDGDAVVKVVFDESVDLPYLWFHGVHIQDSGEVLAVGLRGSIIKTLSLEHSFREIARLGDPETVSFASNSDKGAE